MASQRLYNIFSFLPLSYTILFSTDTQKQVTIIFYLLKKNINWFSSHSLYSTVKLLLRADDTYPFPLSSFSFRIFKDYFLSFPFSFIIIIIIILNPPMSLIVEKAQFWHVNWAVLDSITLTHSHLTSTFTTQAELFLSRSLITECYLIQWTFFSHLNLPLCNNIQ